MNIVAMIDPVIFSIGPFAVRWYGLMLSVSAGLGFWYMLRQGRKLGYSDDFLYDLVILSIVGGVVGARLIYVVTNWSDYAAAPWTIIRTDLGGLSFHGGFLGGVLAGWLYVRKRKASFGQLADLTVPGFTLGITLVRLTNIINHEVTGRITTSGFQHPAQLYGSAIGLILLIRHFYLARRQHPEGYLFWSFAFYYSLLRGLIEETFRDNPLFAWGYVYEPLGMGFFTLVHLLTPLFMGLTWWMLKRTKQVGKRS
jgi:phosphatidylglycerol:prolipoprotein diacylglycerol transferase